MCILYGRTYQSLKKESDEMDDDGEARKQATEETVVENFLAEKKARKEEKKCWQA
jgi:hypothetical protein